MSTLRTMRERRPAHAASIDAASIDAASIDFAAGDLRHVRSFVAARAHEAGLGRQRTDELTVAVHELAANSIDHGGGRGSVRGWVEPDALVIEVSDAGRLADPDGAGRTPPSADQHRGRGLWIVRQLADALHVRRTPQGQTFRVVTQR